MTNSHSNNDSCPTFRTRIESFEGTKEPLDILDQEISQGERDLTSDDLARVHTETPWWTSYAKPEVTRQRMLTGQSQYPAVPKQQRKISNASKISRRDNKEGMKLWNAYEAHESRQNAEKVQSARTFKRKRNQN